MTRFLGAFFLLSISSCFSRGIKNYDKKDCNCRIVNKAIQLVVKDYLDGELIKTEVVGNYNPNDPDEKNIPKLKSHYQVLITCMDLEKMDRGALRKGEVDYFIKLYDQKCRSSYFDGRSDL